MVVEVLAADFTQVPVKDGSDEKGSAKLNQGSGLDEPIKFGSHGNDGAIKAEMETISDVPKDAVDEWPAPKQIHTFYFVKFRSYEDPKLRAKIELADKELQKRTQSRIQINDSIRAKRAERAQVIAQLKPLTAEDKRYRSIVDEKRKEMEPLQQALGKLRSANNANRERGVGLCSSEAELNDLIQSLHYRMQHESISLVEEKQLLREIKQLEGTREKVIANAAMKAKIEDSLGQKEAIQDQVKLIGVDLDGVRKEQQEIRAKIKHFEEELKAIDNEISSLQGELTVVNQKRDKAYESLVELRKQRDEGNAHYFQNRSTLNNARDLAAKKDVAALEELSHIEVEKFISIWSRNKSFRDDYEKRILPSLDIRQLSRDGRMRNPDEKPLVLEAPAASEPEAVAKINIKQPKEEPKPIPQHDTIPIKKVQKEHNSKLTELVSTTKAGDPDEESVSLSEKTVKEPSTTNEIDAEKLKEMKREEEIAKAKQAFERKKKLAEKAAAKAAVRAQKEAEKKLKEREKRAKKKAAASATPAGSEEQAEANGEVAEPEAAEENIESPVPSKIKEQKENPVNVRYRNRAKGQDPVPKAKMTFRRKKSTPYWVWAAPAALLVVVLVAVGYYYFL
ncbi:PREDICTED: proton pump-interactor 1-like [Nelumbo nucifera]|uniref:Proton pump-interactor 1-like n=1 Tax=Nelumbo nucifera TaxID=4432 RepID=A0A1U8ADE8_NELNU|nr:PREDICTED: proton pump-interactor 1-like [Nelumbo nucifera]